MKKDWISGARECLDEFEIHMSFQEIKLMKTTQYKNIVKKQANKAAFRYLLQKQEGGKKANLLNMIQSKWLIISCQNAHCQSLIKEKCLHFVVR